jgi:hypothetical protein
MAEKNKVKSSSDKDGTPTVEVQKMLFVNSFKTPGSNRPDYKGSTGDGSAAWMKTGTSTDGKTGDVKKWSGISINVSLIKSELLEIIETALENGAISKEEVSKLFGDK